MKQNKKNKQRIYYITWRLKNKFDYPMNRSSKTINVQASELYDENLPEIVKKYFGELLQAGYGVQTTL